MCGIFIALSKKGALNKLACSRSVNELYNRGPDSLKYNYFFNNSLFFSNTILSITGKVTKDKNTVSSVNKNFFISFNGEIYNYKDLQYKYLRNNSFSTDTHVLVNLHEKRNSNQIPSLLNGMFSYAVLDIKKNEMNIVTDPQGEKGVYYYNDNNYLIISSTIKSILIFLKNNWVNISIQKNVVKDYFSTRHYMPILDSCYKKLKILENATILNINLKNLRVKKLKYDDPFNWIDEKKYKYFNKISEDDILAELDYELNNQAKMMIPDKKFGTIFSGGIDSSLQSAILAKHGKPSIFLNINHINKDKINKKFRLFEKFIDKKIKIKNINKVDYFRYANKCAEVLSSPFFTHDLPSRMFLSEEFKKNNCKVFFSADGCDELFGGQQVYLSSFKKINSIKNYSPYTSISHNSLFLNNYKTSKRYRDKLENYWTKAYNMYEFVESKKQRIILSSLFCDYFIQSIYVANKSTDLICSDNSVEPRNIFIQKKILKFIINLPLMYKFNTSAKGELKQKYILKKLFIKYFNKNLIFKKEGFSGFPEVFYNSYNNLSKKLNFSFLKKPSNYYDVENYNRDLSWKMSNLDLFFKNYYK